MNSRGASSATRDGLENCKTVEMLKENEDAQYSEKENFHSR